MDDFLEKGLLRNSKRFSAVFERIYDKYDREFENGEDGGKELDHHDMLHWEEEEEEEEEESKGERLRPSYHLLMDVPSGSDAEEDLELTALLHQKVVQVKKEICWEEEELRDLERARQKAVARKDCTSTSSEDEMVEEKCNSSTGMGRRKRRRGRPRLTSVNSGGDLRRSSLQDGSETFRNGSETFRDGSETYRDGSETLYETEYHSESEHSCVQSGPEERKCVTPPWGPLKREAFSTPRVVRKRRLSSIKRNSIRDLHTGEKRVAPNNKAADPTSVQTEEEVFFSGYESAGECHSGPGEHPIRRSSADSEQLEYVGSPQQPLNDNCLTPDVLTSPPPILSDSYDENLPVVVQHGGKHEEREGTQSEGNAPEVDSKLQDPSKSFLPVHPKDGGEENKRVLCHRCSQREQVKPTSEDRTLGRSRSLSPGSCDQSRDDHVTTPLVIHNTNVSYVSYHHCGHTHPPNGSRLALSGGSLCPHCFPPQTCCGCVNLPLSQCHHLHPSHTHYHRPPAHPQPHTYKQNPTTKYPGPFGNVFAPFKDCVKDTNTFGWTILPLPPPKRKLDSEVSDLADDTELPQLKKQCIQ